MKPGDEDPNVKVDPTLDQVSKVAQRRAYREERESVAEQFYAKIRQILLGSDVMRLRAKLDLRKEMTRDFKDKYQRVAEQYMKLKSDINVSNTNHYVYRLAWTTMRLSRTSFRSPTRARD